MPIYREKEEEAISANEELKYMGALDAAWHNQGDPSRHRMSILLSSLIFVFIAWAAWASIDEVSRAMGQLVPSGKNQEIQHLEGGILKELLVREGQVVQKDQILARIENVSAESQVRDTETRIHEHTAAIIRLEAEIDDKEPVFSKELMDAVPQIVENEKNAHKTRQIEQQQKESMLESQLEQRKQELQEQSNRRSTFSQALSLASRRADLARPLVKQNLYPEVDFLNLQQEVVRLRGEISAATNNISKIESAIKEAGQRKQLSRAEFRAEAVKELNKRKSERSSLEELRTTGSDRVKRTELLSPVNGVINSIKITTINGVIKPGEIVMEIVPKEDSLLVEARVRPADIAFIHQGQKASVKITAYDHAIYGSLDGVVEQISPGTIRDPVTNDIYYVVKVRTKNDGIQHKGTELPITPGRVANVDIRTGKTTVLSYLLKPIFVSRANALSER